MIQLITKLREDSIEETLKFFNLESYIKPEEFSSSSEYCLLNQEKEFQERIAWFDEFINGDDNVLILVPEVFLDIKYQEILLSKLPLDTEKNIILFVQSSTTYFPQYNNRVTFDHW